MAGKKIHSRGVLSNIDWVMVLLWFALVIVGIMNIYSSGTEKDFYDIYEQSAITSVERESGSPIGLIISGIFDFSQRHGKQIIWVGFAMLLAFVILMIDPKTIPPLSNVIYITSIILLIGVLILGTEINGSKSWYRLGGIYLQPSEFAKMATALAVAKYMSNINFDIKSKNSLLVIMGIFAIPLILILLQPDMGSALVLFSMIIMLYRFGFNKYIVAGLVFLIFISILALVISEVVLAAILVLLAIILVLVMRSKTREILFVFGITGLVILYVFGVEFVYNVGLKPHQKERIEVYTYNLKGIDKDIRNVGYNFYQSKVAIGSGGLLGKGFCKGTQTKMNFIPEQDTDFIFCTVGEEWGFVGSTFVTGLYLLLVVRIITRAEMQRSTYSKIYGYSVASIIFFHFMINVGMTIGLTPVIGIPLPFLSYGGSSLWSFTLLLFIFIKQDMHRREIIG